MIYFTACVSDIAHTTPGRFLRLDDNREIMAGSTGVIFFRVLLVVFCYFALIHYA